MTVNAPKTNGQQPRRLLLVSVPRTASNLLLKVLNISNQPNLITSPKCGYFFYDAFMTAAKDGRLSRPLDQWTADEKNETKSTFQRCFNELEEYTTRATAENKTMFAKEHAFWFVNPGAFTRSLGDTDTPDDLKEFHISLPGSYGPTQTFSANNQTVLSDEYLRTWQISFIIRHPALAWPSLYRAMQKLLKEGFIDDDGVKGVSIVNMTLTYSRNLFDWCIEQPDESVTPLVIDAHDVIHNRAVVTKFCEMAGLDPTAMQYEWSGAKPQSDHASLGDAEEQKRIAIFLSTLQESTGIVKEKAPASVDIDAEVAKWRVEFGDDVAQLLEKATRDSMPDYEYLKAHKVVV
ncbi:uncharacterized protein N7515_001997 [Penicillium bovifimosum]|uniref:Uncharacterized protein n=1 Tax=Penicillium bovifimosum TaxID=126998 RepID=A0A9W9HAS3_9EURO|nr:uncharacterized protein N7515_001997 [Penicillium bovifimosum]KAJ5143210.1 hypothetical protein N7515_001997 [Penicillium bovifimosum]